MTPHLIHVFIDRKKFDLDASDQSGESLKQLAGIPRADVLFLDQPGDDLVISNEATITLKNGAHLHSQPAADYGDEQRYREKIDVPQPDGWTFVIYRDFRIPSEFRPDRVDLLVKLPPTFPDAAPDMFWVSPHVTVGCGGASPRGTSSETVLGASWQRFSWHLASGTWRAGVSTLRDFLRCIIGRFERRD